MPDILFIPSTADQDEIVTLSDRHQELGDMLVMQGRVYSLIAPSTQALSQPNDRSRDRKYFGLMDALLADPQSPCRTPEAAAWCSGSAGRGTKNAVRVDQAGRRCYPASTGPGARSTPLGNRTDLPRLRYVMQSARHAALARQGASG